MTGRIKQFRVVELSSKPGRKAVPTGQRLAFMAFTAKEAAGKLAAWLASTDKGWRQAKTRLTVRKGQVVWSVGAGVGVP